MSRTISSNRGLTKAGTGWLGTGMFRYGFSHESKTAFKSVSSR